MSTTDDAAQPTPTRLAIEERALTLAELRALKPPLSAADLVGLLQDGRAHVRANALLGLAAQGHGGAEYVPHLRDGDAAVARAAAEALEQVGKAQRANVVAIAGKLDDAHTEIATSVSRMFARLVGAADAELIAALDTAAERTVGAILAACEQAGVPGLRLLEAAARHDRARVRINALRGVARLGELEPARSIELLAEVERDDKVSDVRAAARAAAGVLAARLRGQAANQRKAAGPPPAAVPELDQADLPPEQATRAAASAPLEELLRVLADPRRHVRLNAIRMLAAKGAAAPATARALAPLLRDDEPTVRAEAAQALAKLGAVAAAAAPALIRALADDAAAVVTAATDALASLGDAAADALVEGLDTPSDAHGGRVAALIARLPDAAERLRVALASTTLDVRVHAATGLGDLGARPGAASVAASLTALGVVAVAGNARLRAAVTRAIGLLAPRPDLTPRPPAIAGFETELLDASALTKLDPAALALLFTDGRAVVRANAATALGAAGATGHATALAGLLKDDDRRVRVAAARALDRLGDAAIIEAAPALVAALAHAEVAAVVAPLLAARKAKVEPALIAGLDTADEAHGLRVAELITQLPNAKDLLFAAFDGQAHNATINAAFGIGLLGAKRAGEPGRLRLLDGLTGPVTRKHHACRKALGYYKATM
jgi:HEAT repeat protein